MLESECRKFDNGHWVWKQIGDRDNHYLDCEAMQVCGAIMLKLVGGGKTELSGVKTSTITSTNKTSHIQMKTNVMISKIVVIDMPSFCPSPI